MGCYTVYLVREPDGRLWWDGAKRGALHFERADDLLAHLADLPQRPVAPDFSLLGWCQGWYVDRGAKMARAYSCTPRLPGIIPWQGWDAAWASEGRHEVAALAGVSYEEDPFRARLDGWLDCEAARLMTRHPDRTRFLYRWDPQRLELRFDWYWHDGVEISVIDEAGRVWDHGFDDGDVLFEALGRGPALLQELARHPPCPGLANDQAGAVIDAQRREIWFWMREQVAPQTLDALRERWPGYRVAREPLGLAGHLQRTGRRHEVEGWSALQDLPLPPEEEPPRALQHVTAIEVPSSELQPEPLPAEEQALLQAVYADLDADAPRLVYADYLLSRGDRRGELIRVQCALEALRRKPESAAIERLQAEEARLLRIYAPSSVGALSDVRKWRRGFPAAVTVNDLERFLAEGVLEAMPTVDEVALTKPVAPEALLALLRSPGFARVRALELSLSREPFAPTVSALIRGLPQLRALRLSRFPLGDEGARALAALPELSQLTALSLWECQLSEQGLAALKARLGEGVLR